MDALRKWWPRCRSEGQIIRSAGLADLAWSRDKTALSGPAAVHVLTQRFLLQHRQEHPASMAGDECRLLMMQIIARNAIVAGIPLNQVQEAASNEATADDLAVWFIEALARTDAILTWTIVRNLRCETA